MVRIVAGDRDARGLRFAIVAARFNEPWSDRLLAGALAALREQGAADRDLLVVRVPGSFELPVAVRRLAAAGAHDAIIATGVILRGETTHAQHIGEAVNQALMQIQLQHGVPVIHEVLLLENKQQAEVRCVNPKHNRGLEAAQTALAMARVLASL